MKTTPLAQIIRVNHAGEMGAKVIYSGQLLAFKLKKQQNFFDLTKHMLNQEKKHFDYFNQQILSQQVRPTIMQPIWQLGGFALGFCTALISPKAAMVCTVAVEEVIDKHYQDQIDFLQKTSNANTINDEISTKIKQFQSEELEHRDTAYHYQAKQFIGFNPLYNFIQAITKVAINISKKI